MTSSTVNDVLGALNQLLENPNVPQNIRRCMEMISQLFQESLDTMEAKKSKTLQFLDDMVDDPNIDMLTRTSLYQVTALVESLS